MEGDALAEGLRRERDDFVGCGEEALEDGVGYGRGTEVVGAEDG